MTNFEYTVKRFQPYEGRSFHMATTEFEIDNEHTIIFTTFKQYGIFKTRYHLHRGNEKVSSLIFCDYEVIVNRGSQERATKNNVIARHLEAMLQFDDKIELAKKVIEEKQNEKN